MLFRSVSQGKSFGRKIAAGPDQQGVPRNQVIFLKDQEATLSRIKNKFMALLAKMAKDDLLFLYFAGHGAKDKQGKPYFICYDAKAGKLNDTAWSLSSIFDSIRTGFKGRQAILTADCCYSGGLAVGAVVDPGKTAFACLSSALSNQPSTGKWTFTESLISGFQGSPLVDRNADQKISLQELADYTFAEMSFGEQQFSSFKVTRGFPPQLVLGPASQKKFPEIGKRLEVEWGKKWWRAKIIDSKPGQFKIHYLGWDEKWDEWLLRDSTRIREYQPKIYPVGSDVQAEWGKKWWPAKILKVKAGLHYIHYPGWSDSWNEWVGANRLRPIPVKR